MFIKVTEVLLIPRTLQYYPVEMKASYVFILSGSCFSQLGFVVSIGCIRILLVADFKCDGRELWVSELTCISVRDTFGVFQVRGRPGLGRSTYTEI